MARTARSRLLSLGTATVPGGVSRRAVAAGCAGLLVVAGVGSSVALGGPSAAATARLAVPKHNLHSVHLPNSAVHPGSVLVAFRAPVSASGGRIHTTPKGARKAGLPEAAVKNETVRVNNVLAGLKATSVRHLFTNVPTAELNAARARAMRATGRYLTDLTQVYEVKFSPSINDGEAANRLQKSGLVWTAMPDHKYSQPVREKTTTPAGVAPASAANAALSTASGLPPNYSYATDGQSYNDAASNNVTGAAVAVAKKFGQQPGQGETITNISLGTIDNTSTVLEGGQRFLEQSGFPKIPTFISHQTCTPAGSCTVSIDGAGTNTDDGQGDLTEVLLDFSTMAPPPRGDARVPNPQAPGQLGEILGAAYGANYRLINPKVNGTDDFVAAFLGAGFLQKPKPSVVTASIGNGLPPGAFPDDEFEAETLIRDIVTTLTQGQDIFVTISAGDGQDDTDTAGPPNGASGPYNLSPPGFVPPDLDSFNPADPDYTYLWTSEARLLPDSGSNSAGGTTLNDVFNNSPNNTSVSPLQAHTQTTTETRWTGQQNFHSGIGNRLSVAAPADDVLFLAQVEDAQGNPIDPVSVEPELVGGTSASCPEIAAAAAVVRQVARLTGHPLTAVQTRDLLAATGHKNVTPTFDLAGNSVGRTLDLTAAVNKVLSMAGVSGKPELVRMTVAQRKGVPGNSGYGRTFYTDTPQDAVARTATIDLSQGLDPASAFNNETLAPTGNNLNSPITFGVDAAFLPPSARFSWSLAFGNKTVKVPAADFDRSRASLRLLPTEIFDLLKLNPTSSQDRAVRVTASTGGLSITEEVTFKALASATYTIATSPAFVPLATAGHQSSVTVHYDLRGLRGATSGQLVVSDIDRALPRAFTDRDRDAHGIVIPLGNLVGSVSVPLAQLQGAGVYGLALRGVDAGVPLNGLNGTVDSTSSWIPLRIAPAKSGTPTSPKVQAEASFFASTTPVWWDTADVEAAGSQRFSVTYDVRAVPGARSTIVEFSAPSTDFLGSLFIGNVATFPSANRFTNPLGDRLDSGNRLGDPGETSHRVIQGSTHGVVTLTTSAAGLTTPTDPASCDHTYQVRVFAADNQGRILGSSSYTSLLSVADLSSAGCNPPPVAAP
jgi:hypothetical protein